MQTTKGRTKIMLDLIAICPCLFPIERMTSKNLFHYYSNILLYEITKENIKCAQKKGRNSCLSLATQRMRTGHTKRV